MVKKGIVFDHIISSEVIEVDKAKVNLFANLLLPTCVKDIRSSLGHAGFYTRFIKDFSKIANPLSSHLAKETPSHFSKECEVVFTKLEDAPTTTPILHPLIWGKFLNSCVMHRTMRSG